MKNYLIALLAVVTFGLASCGGGSNDKAADNQEATQAVEQKADQAQQQAQAASDQKADEQKADDQKADDQQAGNDQAAAGGKDGKTLFMENGCVACHKETEKSVGPALKDIAAKYGDKAKLVNFLKGNGEAIVDPANFATMKPNLEITKKMNDADVGALADYILSIK